MHIKTVLSLKKQIHQVLDFRTGMQNCCTYSSLCIKLLVLKSEHFYCCGECKTHHLTLQKAMSFLMHMRVYKHKFHTSCLRTLRTVHVLYTKWMTHLYYILKTLYIFMEHLVILCCIVKQQGGREPRPSPTICFAHIFLTFTNSVLMLALVPQKFEFIT